MQNDNYSGYKKKLKVKTNNPGDLLKAYKLKVNNKSKYFGETDTQKKTLMINKKLSKKPSNKRPAKKGATKYPELKDTIYHEKFHAEHPKATEKTVYKKTRKAMKTIGKKASQKLYSLFK